MPTLEPPDRRPDGRIKKSEPVEVNPVAGLTNDQLLDKRNVLKKLKQPLNEVDAELKRRHG